TTTPSFLPARSSAGVSTPASRPDRAAFAAVRAKDRPVAGVSTSFAANAKALSPDTQPGAGGVGRSDFQRVPSTQPVCVPAATWSAPLSAKQSLTSHRRRSAAVDPIRAPRRGESTTVFARAFQSTGDEPTTVSRRLLLARMTATAARL